MNRCTLNEFYRRISALFCLFVLALGVSFTFFACADRSVYLVPNEIPGNEGNSGKEVKVQIRPIYTSEFESKDREKYLFDFTSHFTAIEIQFRNDSSDPVQWTPEQTFLKNSENREFRVFSEEEAYHYYKSGDTDANSIVLLDKPYDQQKEDIENIKRSMMKAVLLPPGGEVSGLLLFQKILQKNCENLELTVGGILVNQAARSVRFRLSCPEN